MATQFQNFAVILSFGFLLWLTFTDGLSAPRQDSSSRRTVRRQPIGRITALDRVKIDRQSDNIFYSQPNFVVHADNSFLKKLTSLYDKLIPDDSIVLDIMSSHVSHLPPHKKLRRVDVHGMNEEELLANEARIRTNGKYFVRNLNENPSFVGMCDSNNDSDDSATTAEYDVVLCCVGVQYLEEPESVFAEVGRVLKPGSGIAIVSFTNRFFYEKALTGWIERGMGERARLVTDYFRAAGGFGPIDVEGDGRGVMAQFMSAGGIGGDPFVAVVARRLADP